MTENLFDIVRFDAAGLAPAVVQDAENGEVLMVGYMNREALEKTLATGRATFWSRSRQKFWIKGETSGHFQHVREVFADCDADCILLKVEQVGAACHTGFRTCFFRRADAAGALELVGEPLVEMPG
ncbi:MAG: phosphoribosyl-AMP cyclohydrolase [Armatimonadota bacterium]|nr:phosphoribosyl-AMP cyclohydrolase [Armatimonadota bacterium]